MAGYALARAAAAAGRILGLDEDRMVWALAIAAARASGARETHGNLAKDLVTRRAGGGGGVSASGGQAHRRVPPRAGPPAGGRPRDAQGPPGRIAPTGGGAA